MIIFLSIDEYFSSIIHAMKRKLPSLSALRAFEAAARHQSFKLAAEELSVSATAISHQIRSLETELNCQLFLRKTRQIELTPEATDFFRSIKEAFDLIANSTTTLQKHTAHSVTLTTTSAFATKWLIPRLSYFQTAHPDITLYIHTSNEPVNLHTGTADLAIRYGVSEDLSLSVTHFIQNHFSPIASPKLGIQHYDDLFKYPLIHFDWLQPCPVAIDWQTWLNLAHVNLPRHQPHIRFSDENHAIQATIAGQGVALLNLLLVDDEIQRGLLETVCSPMIEGLAYYIVHSKQRPLNTAVYTVKQWLLNIQHQINF